MLPVFHVADRSLMTRSCPCQVTFVVSVNFNLGQFVFLNSLDFQHNQSRRHAGV